MALLNDRESGRLHDTKKEDNDRCFVVLPSENDGRPKTRPAAPSQYFRISIHYSI